MRFFIIAMMYLMVGFGVNIANHKFFNEPVDKELNYMAVVLWPIPVSAQIWINYQRKYSKPVQSDDK